MKIPDYPKEGKSVEATIREMIDYMKATTIVSFPGNMVKESRGGTSIVPVKTQRPRKPTMRHPWKVTANGDDTVTVAPGRILSYRDGINLYILEEFLAYVGGTVTASGDGVIYGSTPIGLSFDPIANIDAPFTDSNGDTGDVNITFMRVFPDRESVEPTITVGFAAAMPTTVNTFFWEIARVTFADGVVTGIEQVLTHNPTLWGFVEPPS